MWWWFIYIGFGESTSSKTISSSAFQRTLRTLPYLKETSEKSVKSVHCWREREREIKLSLFGFWFVVVGIRQHCDGMRRAVNVVKKCVYECLEKFNLVLIFVLFVLITWPEPVHHAGRWWWWRSRAWRCSTRAESKEKSELKDTHKQKIWCFWKLVVENPPNPETMKNWLKNNLSRNILNTA